MAWLPSPTSQQWQVARTRPRGQCAAAQGVRRRRVWQAASQPPGLPQDWTQVGPWARQRFKDTVTNAPTTSDIPLVQLCMFIALEEEAAIEVHPELREVLMAQTSLRMPSRAGASTWSLKRLDALADQVYDLVMQTHTQTDTHTAAPQQPAHMQNGSSQPGTEPTQPPVQASQSQPPQLQQAQPQASEPSQHQSPALQRSEAQASSVGAWWEELATQQDTDTSAQPHGPSQPTSQSDTAVNDNTTSSVRPLLPAGLAESGLLRVVQAINTVLFEWHGYGPCNRYGNPRDSHLSSVMEGGLGCSPALSILYMEVAARLGVQLSAIALEGGRYWLLTSTAPTAASHAASGPATHDTASLEAPATASQDAAAVASSSDQGQLHDRDTHCEPRQEEQGTAVQHDNTPTQSQPGSNAGLHGEGRLLIDPYGQGAILTEDEVCELLGATPESLSHPSTRRHLLSCLLADLRDAYWARAVGCSPAPALMTPLSLTTALNNKAGTFGTSHALDRALSAAEKMAWLEPHSRDHQLKFALLHYHARHWDDAWIELGLLIERLRQQGISSVSDSSGDVDTSHADTASIDLLSAELLLEKIRLQLSVTVNP